MSSWAYINGNVELSSRCYKYSGKKAVRPKNLDGILYIKDNKSTLKIAKFLPMDSNKIYRDSYPLIKERVNKVFSELKEKYGDSIGEFSIPMHHALLSTKKYDEDWGFGCNGGSNFTFIKFEQERIKKLLNCKTWKEARDKMGFIDNICSAYLNINDSIRYCTVVDVLKMVEFIFEKLYVEPDDDNKVLFNAGYLEWCGSGDYDKFRFAVRFGDFGYHSGFDQAKFMIMDKDTNKILEYKLYKKVLIKDKDKHYIGDKLVVSESKNWSKIAYDLTKLSKAYPNDHKTIE